DKEIALLKRWIEQGAEWKAHWAFLPPAAPVIPDVKDPAWPRNPLDRFVLARLEAEHRPPSPEANQERLIRRVTFDLTGLPPAPRRPSPRSTPSSLIETPAPTSGWSTACWPRRGSASAWPSTGSTWPATPIPTATSPTSTAPCGHGATGSSGRSTKTSRTIDS